MSIHCRSEMFYNLWLEMGNESCVDHPFTYDYFYYMNEVNYKNKKDFPCGEFVYVLFDKYGSVLYVGQTKLLLNRLLKHKETFKDALSIKIIETYNKDCFWLEKALITHLRPKYNKKIYQLDILDFVHIARRYLWKTENVSGKYNIKQEVNYLKWEKIIHYSNSQIKFIKDLIKRYDENNQSKCNLWRTHRIPYNILSYDNKWKHQAYDSGS